MPSVLGAIRELREAGALRYFEYMLLVFFVGVFAYYSHLVDYGAFLGLMGLGIALAAMTFAEVGLPLSGCEAATDREKIDDLRKAEG